MKQLFLLLGLLLMACQPSSKKQTEQALPVTTGITLEEQTPYILGKINRTNLLTYEHSQWFKKEYDAFKINPEWITEMQPLAQGLRYKLFLGTWCEDSQREVPGMLKILDALGMKNSDIVMFATDEDKKTPDQYELGLNITNIPTLIFYKGEEELNRIVELPVETLYKDFAAILTNKPYQHAYFIEVETP